MTNIVGILNLAPESFSGDGVASLEEALRQAERMVQEGVDIIDVGAQSTRPGSVELSLQEELTRVGGLVRDIHQTWPDVAVSIDTTKHEVAQVAIEQGAAVVNDISGGRFDDRMFVVVARAGSRYILTHSQGAFTDMHQPYLYQDVLRELETYFRERIKQCLEQGMRREQIILDPGIGFSKSEKENQLILQHIPRLQKLGFPLCIGLSRKRFIGSWIGEPDPQKRDTATTALHAVCCAQGVEYIRTHNVRQLWECREVIAHMG